MSKKRIRAEHTTLLNWGGADREVIVLPATADAYEQMVEQGAIALCPRPWSGETSGDKNNFRGQARAALRSWGITPPARQARKGLQKART